MSRLEDWKRWINRRRRAYQVVFLTGPEDKPATEAAIVLKDLARFCRAHKSTAIYSAISGTIDPNASARADGRREVWLRIVEHLHLDDRFLTNLREGASDND